MRGLSPLWFALILIVIFRQCLGYSVKAFQSVQNRLEFPFPNSLKSRPNTGVSFSGGGSRSYVASLGYLAAFHELGLIGSIRYVVGVSGGSWATAVYSYFQNASVSDTQLLGPIVFPDCIRYEELSQMGDNCARGFADVPTTLFAAASLREEAVSFADWKTAVQDVYLNPAGIPPGVPFTTDEEEELNIKHRNPSLKDQRFVKLRTSLSEGRNGIDQRPYPIFAATLLGPMQYLPLTPSNRNYSMLEISPLSAGVIFSRELYFSAVNSSVPKPSLQFVGSLVEPFAFASNYLPSTHLPLDVSAGMIDLPEDRADLQSDVCLAVSISSFFPGCNLAASQIRGLQDKGGRIAYWTASETDTATGQTVQDFGIGDGSGLNTDNMITLLQHQVTNIVMFVSTSVPLQPSSEWNPMEGELLQTYIDFDIPAFFGVIPTDLSDLTLEGYDLTKSQVFPKEDFIRVAIALQEAQAKGRGIIATTLLTTVENQFYSIPAGREVTVSWVYLGRLEEWEAELSEDMQAYVIPEENPENLANLKQSGPFRSFPNYETTFADLSFERANLLADMTAWSVVQNADEFRKVLS